MPRLQGVRDRRHQPLWDTIVSSPRLHKDDRLKHAHEVTMNPAADWTIRWKPVESQEMFMVLVSPSSDLEVTQAKRGPDPAFDGDLWRVVEAPSPHTLHQYVKQR